MIADDLFAGAGGWDVGAADLGIVGRGVEIMPAARATRQAAGLVTIHDDVWTYQPDGEAEGLIASPPCQTFSTAGSGSGRRALDVVHRAIDGGAYAHLGALQELGRLVGDERTALVLTPLHFATQHDYRWLAFEQVPTVLPVWEACAVVLRELGWRVWTGNLSAERYGVPQTRRRAVLLASQSRDVDMPAPTHSRYHPRTPDRLDDGALPWVTMADALGWDAGVTLATPFRTRAFDKSIPRRLDQPAPTLAMGHAAGEYRWTTPDGLPRFAQQSAGDPDYGWPDRRPATTVAGRDLVQAPGATANRFNGATKSRNDGVRITVDEAALLQSFPAGFPWQGTRTAQFQQIGNAIPPLLARAALREVTGLSAWLDGMAQVWLPPEEGTA